jgi:hypothetical protein
MLDCLLKTREYDGTVQTFIQVILKAQLKFRKEVLHQVIEDKATYNITKTVRDKKSRHNLSVDELKDNLNS